MASGPLTSVFSSLMQRTCAYVALFSFGLDAKGLGQTHLNLSYNLIGGPIYQSGALFSFADSPETITFRVGVSFVSADQACANAEAEVGSSTFEEIQATAVGLWNERLKKVEIDIPNTPPNITEMLYTSLYRTSLTPVRLPQWRPVCLTNLQLTQNNATGETQGPFKDTKAYYFDSLYCR